MLKKLLLICCLSLFSTPVFAWHLAWDANPPGENVVFYNLYQDGVQIASIPSPALTYDLGATLPEACWTLTAENDLGMESDFSNQVCVGRPSAPANLRLTQ